MSIINLILCAITKIFFEILLYIIDCRLTLIFCRMFLFIIGWKAPGGRQFKQLKDNTKSVIIFSHTTYADFYIFALYLLAFPEKLKNVRVLVKPGPFEYAGPVLRRLGAMPATKFDEKNGGSTKKIIEELDAQENFNFLISPKGTIIKREWRTGYLTIARNLKCQLMVAGLDYEKKKIIVSADNINYDQSDEDIENFLKERLADIVPLYPDEEIVPIRRHNSRLRSIIEGKRVFLICLWLITFWLLLIK